VKLIEQLAAKIADARDLRATSLDQADVLFCSAVTNLNFKESTWTTLRSAVLDKEGAVRSGPFGSQLHHEEFVPSGIPAIGTRDVQVNRFALSGGWYVTPEKFAQLRRYQVSPGDVLVTIVGASIGRFCVVPDVVPLAFTTKHVQALTLDLSLAEPQFVSYMLNFHQRCRKTIFSQCEGSAQPSLNATKVLRIALPLTSLSEQHRIVAFLNGLQAKVDALKKLQTETAAELDALLFSILAKAFRGEL
jgi:type I restriction enzyme S subunit